MDGQKRYTIDQVEQVLPLKTWWAVLFVLPCARRLTLFFANRTRIKPNTVTVFSFLFRLLSAICFMSGRREFLVVGAFLYQFGYILDCADGALARIKNEESERGRYLDHMADLVGVSVNMAALMYGQKMLFSYEGFSVIYVIISTYYIYFITNLLIREKKKAAVPGGQQPVHPLLKAVLRYRHFFFQKNYKFFLSMPDVEALVFFIFPTLNAPVQGVRVGLFGFVIVILIGIGSSFLTVMTHEDQF